MSVRRENALRLADGWSQKGTRHPTWRSRSWTSERVFRRSYRVEWVWRRAQTPGELIQIVLGQFSLADQLCRDLLEAWEVCLQQTVCRFVRILQMSSNSPLRFPREPVKIDLVYILPDEACVCERPVQLHLERKSGRLRKVARRSDPCTIGSLTQHQCLGGAARQAKSQLGLGKWRRNGRNIPRFDVPPAGSHPCPQGGRQGRQQGREKVARLACA